MICEQECAELVLWSGTTGEASPLYRIDCSPLNRTSRHVTTIVFHSGLLKRYDGDGAGDGAGAALALALALALAMAMAMAISYLGTSPRTSPRTSYLASYLAIANLHRIGNLPILRGDTGSGN